MRKPFLHVHMAVHSLSIEPLEPLAREASTCIRLAAARLEGQLALRALPPAPSGGGRGRRAARLAVAAGVEPRGVLAHVLERGLRAVADHDLGLARGAKDAILPYDRVREVATAAGAVVGAELLARARPRRGTRLGDLEGDVPERAQVAAAWAVAAGRWRVWRARAGSGNLPVDRSAEGPLVPTALDAPILGRWLW